MARRPVSSSSRRRKQAPRPSPYASVARLLGIPPIDPLVVRMWAIRGGLALVAVGAVVGVWVAGYPQALAWGAGEAIGRAGFAVRQIDVEGVRRMPKLPVYAAALDQPSNAMPLIDLDGVRERLLAEPWVADAQVSRRLPDTLAIRIIERQPVALWQVNGVVSLIDKSGVVLEAVDATSYPKLPLVVGPGANHQVAALQAMLAEVPALRPEVVDAVWIGGRRWDLHFRSGETLSLPEGEKAGYTLKLFARLDAADGLLKRGFVRFDMRLPDRMVVRVSKEAGSEVKPKTVEPAVANGPTTAI